MTESATQVHPTLLARFTEAIDHWLANGLMTTRTHLVIVIPASLSFPDYVMVRRKRIRVIRRDDVPSETPPRDADTISNIYLIRRRDYTRHFR